MENRNAFTEEQKTFLNENYGKLAEKDLFQKLSELGPEADETSFAEYIRAIASEIESGVFSQSISEEEMASIGGGRRSGDDAGIGATGDWCYENDYYSTCDRNVKINIYENGFPNCGYTVEDGSWCGENDACFNYQVQYFGMKDCTKAWQ